MTVELPAWLVDAYRRTEYVVFDPSGEITLRIGESNQALAQLHDRHQVTGSVFVTAWNPFGEALDLPTNQARTGRLIQFLQGKGLWHVSGEGRGEDASWPAESSLLVLGVEFRQAQALCRMLQQNAVVFAGETAVPQLVLHPHASEMRP